MPSKLTISENIKLIESVIAEVNGDTELFANTLKRNFIPHLSFSQITSVEFCPYQYYLQYVALLEPNPAPIYMEKGKLLHQIIASSYKKVTRLATIDINEYYALIDLQYSGEHNWHLKNAVRIHLDNLWDDCQVIAIEKPFVMLINQNLPPCVGVMDLVLQRGEQIIVIDHKTGRDFYQRDILQMAIYNHYIEECYAAEKSVYYYDNYRWVNNLARIRKPAIQRVEIANPSYYWKEALQRIQSGYGQISEIVISRSAAKSGECYRCPYRMVC